MTSTIGSSLWITLIGMGLVFITILLLWGLMEAVVRLTARTTKGEAAASEPKADTETQAASAVKDDRKLRAAAAAVAFALSKKPSIPFQTAPSEATGSAWQAVMRSYQLNSRGQMTARKSRGK